MNYLVKIFLAAAILVGATSARADWTKISTGTFAWFHAIQFVNERIGFVAGSNGAFLQTIDGGKSWQLTPRFTEDNILDVYFTSEDNGWILCERNIYSLGGAAPSYFMHTRDGGASWQRIELGEDHARLARMFFSKSGEGFAVGEGGGIFSLRENASWKKSALPIRSLMLDGAFFDARGGVLVGGGGKILFTEDGGNTWRESLIYGASTSKINAVFFLGTKYGWAVGSGGTIFTTATGGRIWRTQISGTVRDLYDIVFISAAEGFAFGDGGTILHTKTAGNVWNEVENSSRHKIERVAFIGGRGFAVGFGGTILAYDPSTKVRYVSRPKPQLQRRNK
jgi:photosystem II stability/assembly factor-like uncharacterized protein